MKNVINPAMNEHNASLAYVKPTIEVIELELEGAILGGSATGNNFEDGGSYDRY